MTDGTYLQTNIKEFVRYGGILVYISIVKPWSLSRLFIRIYCHGQYKCTMLTVSAVWTLALYYTYAIKVFNCQ